MISKQHRFHGQKTIEKVYKHGQAFKGGQLSLKALESNFSDYRLAVVVSRKVNKSAVTRNKIRRRIYEQVRLARQGNLRPIKQDIIISVYDDKILRLNPAQLKELLESLLSKLEDPK